jgi:transposase
MMGVRQPQNELFSYQVNLDKRVRADHPLRRVAQAVDFSFVRAEAAHSHGDNGNESVDPAILLKMMFLLFYDNAASERELMNIIPGRLDYLWFLGCGLDDEIAHHSVLSKARRRWGKEVFQQLFVRTVEQLRDGRSDRRRQAACGREPDRGQRLQRPGGQEFSGVYSGLCRGLPGAGEEAQ